MSPARVNSTQLAASRLCPRVIPARAGFSERWAGQGPAGSSHSRSRGLYDRRYTGHVNTGGTLPLAWAGAGMGYYWAGGSLLLARTLRRLIPPICSGWRATPAPASTGTAGKCGAVWLGRLVHSRLRRLYTHPNRCAKARCRASLLLAQALPDQRGHRPLSGRVTPARGGLYP